MSELRKAAEMVVEALVNASDALRDGDNAGCRWILYEQIYALRQALDQYPDTGTDRGAWSDVPDATRWVDELRGDEPEPAFTDQGVKFTCDDCPQGGCCEVVELPPGNYELNPAPPKREWVGLTDKEIKEGAKYSWVDYQAFQSVAWWAEEKLKEKNRG